jgi:hypothetical protein
MENTKKIFKNFAEYWNLVKILSEEQRVILTDSLSPFEQRSLKVSFDKGGWQDLFMRNLCDHHLDEIKENFNIDLLEIKASVISGHPYLINSEFWDFVNDYFEIFPWECIAYIFDGIVTKPHNSEYVKLVQQAGRE